MKTGAMSLICIAAISGAFMLAGVQAQNTASSGSDAVTLDSLPRATFAGGCFWCMEGPFDKLEGVKVTTSGYIGGHKTDPTYKQVSAGGTGHTEAVQIIYDPAEVSYEELLDVFWVNHDPTEADGQFCDKGSQYRPGVFYHDEEQKLAAEASRQDVQKSRTFDEPVVTEITMADTFYPAEDYHQDYYTRNPVRYNMYRFGCGRDRRLEQLWGKSDH